MHGVSAFCWFEFPGIGVPGFDDFWLTQLRLFVVELQALSGFFCCGRFALFLGPPSGCDFSASPRCCAAMDISSGLTSADSDFVIGCALPC